MFTGIVQGIGTIDRLDDHGELRSFAIAVPDGFADGIEIGASVSVDGVCLTVTAIPAPTLLCFDVVLQSLRITTLADLAVGSRVNIERAARDGAEIGGHPLSGHVDFTGTVEKVVETDHNKMLRIAMPPLLRPYIFAKGYIAINGCSLTVSDVRRDEGWFEIWLIPETRRVTTFEAKQAGDKVNIEIERATQVMVDTVREAVKESLGELTGAITMLLAEKGLSLDDLVTRKLPRLPDA